MIHVTQSEADILAVMDTQPRSHEWRGLEIVKASNGRVRRSAVYVHLLELGDKGLVTVRPLAKDNSPLFTYQLTDDGARQAMPRELASVVATARR